MQVLKEAMLKRLLDSNPRLLIHIEHFVKKVDRLRWLVWEPLGKVHLGFLG